MRCASRPLPLSRGVVRSTRGCNNAEPRLLPAPVFRAHADPACASDRATLAQLSKAWFSHDPAATAKSARGGASAVFRRATTLDTADRFEVTLKAVGSAGAERALLCMNVPAAATNKCRTLRELCGGGGLCRANFTTGRFRVGKRLHVCCVAAHAQLGGELQVCVLRCSTHTCRAPGPVHSPRLLVGALRLREHPAPAGPGARAGAPHARQATNTVLKAPLK